ncbi:MAG: RNA pseudouridine synthase [Bacteroidetes bacterium]|nr:MAG: RNA pseudouridine synthase [Bacteroidota bacterium]
MIENNEKFEDDQELFEHHKFVVDKGQNPLRIDKFLMSRLENSSRNKIQNAAIAGSILVNNSAVRSSYKVKPDDVVTIVLSHPVREFELVAEDIPLDILYEDEDLIVINKEAGMVVHPAYANYTGTLVNALMFHFRKTGVAYDEKTGPYLVHRIDKNTSGVMLVAKTELAQTRLGKQFFDHSISRKYNALVWGDLKDDEGTITGNIGRSPKDRRVFTVYEEEDRGKHAVTHYKIIERLGYTSFIECQLETGRTHQIRVHMRHIGHTIFSDETYGGNQILKGTTFTKYKQFVSNCFKICPRQALHAKSLGFIHPITKKEMYFESPLPEDMSQLIEKWRKYATHKLIGG